MKRLPPWLTVLTAGLLFTWASAQAPPTATSPSQRLEPDYRVSPEARVTSATITGTSFAKFLNYKNYEVTLDGGATYTGGFVYGPGHHISAIAALVLDPNGIPYATFKTGDTRLSRALRNEPYVATSGIAGRWDKEGYSAGKIVLAELDEEIGGEVVDGTFRRLGDEMSPTMPFESTECDEYFMAAVQITGDPYGDGGQMEVLGLIGPTFFSPQEAIAAMDQGRISDAARARTMFGRAWSSIGYLPQLGIYVQNYPELLARYDTLALGPLEHLRAKAKGGPVPKPRPKGDSLQARINTVVVDSATNVDVSGGAILVDARIRHAFYQDRSFYADYTLERAFTAVGVNREWSNKARDGMVVLDPDFASQFLWLSYDRAKVAVYYLDPDRGPMVEMAPQVRPALAFAPGGPKVVRRDIRDVQVKKEITLFFNTDIYAPREAPKIPLHDPLSDLTASYPEVASLLPGHLHLLANRNAASSGQSDLFYHYIACRVEPTAEGKEFYVPLAEAIRLGRQGHGDAQTEATLLRLADHLGWVPELGMARSKVVGIISGARPAGP